MYPNKISGLFIPMGNNSYCSLGMMSYMLIAILISMATILQKIITAVLVPKSHLQDSLSS